VQERIQVDVLRKQAQEAQNTGDAPTAIQHMRRACELAPDDALVHKQFASLLATHGQWSEALEYFDASLRLGPSDGHTWYLAGLALHSAGQYPQAVNALSRAMRELSANDRVSAAFAEALFHGALPDAALPWWRRYAARHAKDAAIQLRLGELLSRNGMHEEALLHFKALPATTPADAASKQIAVAQTFEDLGKRREALEAYHRALALKPGWAVALAGILPLQQADTGADMSEQAIRLLEQKSLPPQEAALLNYALGKTYDTKGHHALAMACWHEANRLRRDIAGEPAVDALNRRVDLLVRCTSRWPTEMPVLPQDESDPQLVFIVGMPRSGTTLTERMLGSHSEAHGAGELAELPLIARMFWPLLQGHAPRPWDTPLTRDTLLSAKASYLRAIRRGAAGSERVLIDKAPLNFFNLWLVAALFPGAKIVWCKRDPLDVGVSIYSENFALDERLCTRLDGIGHYIAAQQRLMAHWMRTLPLQFHTVIYETLARSPEAEAKALIAFAGLDWEPGCLEFHKREDGVQTPSRWQVRQPVHTRSIGRWKHYSEHLAPLTDALNQAIDEPPSCSDSVHASRP
jgi:tetratricopeptide (TPR) repeat protein